MSDPITDLKQELLAAAGRQLANQVPQARRHRTRILLLAASLSIATVVAFFVATPWKSSPGFLEQAQAALTPPRDAIVHIQQESEMPAGSGCQGTSSEMWVDYASSAFRALFTDCGGRKSEVGGVMGTEQLLEFVPPDTFIVPDLLIGVDLDPAASVRDAIQEGRAHDEGEAQVGGRTVQRIRFECPLGEACEGRPGYVYVDPETFLPVRMELPGGFNSLGQRFDLVVRYGTFEYLPRTAANVALTDIRAQHPGATGP